MYEIDYISGEGFIYVKTLCDYTIDDVDKFLRAAAEYASKYTCNKLLIDHRECNFIASIMEIHETAKFLERFGLNVKMKGVVVYNRDEDKYAFADTVSSNWSMGILCFMDNFDKAKEWLLSELT